jgi:hypothetical protein
MDPKLLSELKRESLKYRKYSSSSNKSNTMNNEYLNIIENEDPKFDENYFRNNIEDAEHDFIPPPPPPPPPPPSSIIEDELENKKDIIINLNLDKKLFIFGLSLFFGMAGLFALNDYIMYKYI